jgi:prolyl-tRNA editing enzyme YbaK/EbsC (Cys-tRNA(Pro) deacylase)
MDQIAKSIIFGVQDTNEAVLFITAGGNKVDVARASDLAGAPLGKADAALIRAQTGFAIGGVSPLGHLTAPRAWFDPRLLDFDLVWAAAGTPHHVFGLDPTRILSLSGAVTADFTE